MRHSRWILSILSVILLQTLCYGTSIVWVVSATGEYVVLAADSRMTGVGALKSNNTTCKVIALDDTLFFNGGNAIIGTYRGKPWSSLQVAKEIYKTSKNHDAQTLSIAWSNRASAWFSTNSSLADLQSAAMPDGSLVSGGFINFDSNENPASFSQKVSFDAGTRQLLGQPVNQSNGQMGISSIHPELVIEFDQAETPRALKAYGSLKLHNVGKDLSYDIEYVRKAVQFVIDETYPTKRKSMFMGQST